MLIDKINECLNEYDVVSFDIFDTLINRIVGRPHNVFSVIAWTVLYHKHIKTWK